VAASFRFQVAKSVETGKGRGITGKTAGVNQASKHATLGLRAGTKTMIKGTSSWG